MEYPDYGLYQQKDKKKKKKEKKSKLILEDAKTVYNFFTK